MALHGDSADRPALLLIVDSTTRTVIEPALTDAGHDVVVADDLPNASCLVESLPIPPALVLLDLHLPSTRVDQLLSWLQRRCASVPVVFISSAPEHPDLLLPGLLLEQPFTLAALLRVVRNVLGMSRPA
ncbi:MAG TPA: response regulator [Gemmatimonadales bacterium]|nr:response regulator [Gemmatimonadales bacterium]